MVEYIVDLKDWWLNWNQERIS